MKIVSYTKGIICTFLLLISGSVFADWVDISSDIEITKSRPALDRVNRVYFVYLDITNKSTAEMAGHFRLNIKDSSIPVINADGELNGSPYKSIYIDSLAVGQSERIKVEFFLQRKALIFSVTLYQQEIIEENIDSENLVGVELVDKLSNEIRVLVYSSEEPSAIEVIEGIKNDTPYELVTNGLIQVNNTKIKTKQTIKIKPASLPKYVLVFNGNLQLYERVPYFKNDDGSIQFEVVEEKTLFAVTK